jgi:hypothetical protein
MIFDSDNNSCYGDISIVVDNILITIPQGFLDIAVYPIFIDPTFTEHTIDGNFDGARSVYACDVDGDGDIDVLGAAYNHDDITWWEQEGSPYNAPVVDSFAVDHEGVAGWDKDNNDVQVDFSFTDPDGDSVDLYFTYNKGSQARQPTIADNDASILNAINQTNYDLDWTNTAGWIDYAGDVYVRIRAYDGTNYSDDSGLVIYQDYDFLDYGIDGTAPTTSVNDAGVYQYTVSSVGLDTTATDSPQNSNIAQVQLYFRYSADNISWGSYQSDAIDYSAPYEFTFYFPNGVGWYRVGTRGTDILGNVEANPPNAGDDEFFHGNTPIISDVTPANESTITYIQPTCSARVSHPDWELMDVYFYENSTGSWVLRETDVGLGSGSYPDFDFTQADSNGQYWWTINLTDGFIWVNKTFTFTIGNATGSVNMSAYDIADFSALTNWNYIIQSNTGGTIATGSVAANPKILNTTEWDIANYYTFTFTKDGYFPAIQTRSSEEILGVDNFIVDMYLTEEPEGYGGAGNESWYEILVTNRFGTPLENTRVEMIHVANYTNASQWNGTTVYILYTDNNGEVQFPYIEAYDTYFVNLTKDGYKSRFERWVPSPLDFYKTFMLDYLLDENESYLLTDVIRITGKVAGTTLYTNYSDLSGQTINCQIYLYQINSVDGSVSLLATHTTTGNSSITWQYVTFNTSHSHKVVVHYNHSLFGYRIHTMLFAGAYTPLILPNEFNALVTAIAGYCPFGWSNAIMLGVVTIGYFSVERKNLGVMLMLIGGIMFVISFIVGFSNIFITSFGGVIPILTILGGVLIIWDDSRRG